MDDVERDEYGIPVGRHTATCGCQLEGRDLLEPCAEHLPAVQNYLRNVSPPDDTIPPKRVTPQ